MRKIVIVGAGKVGSALAPAISSVENVELSIYNRSYPKAESLAQNVGAKCIQKLDDIEGCDLCILAISDDSIEEVSKNISRILPNIPIAHTAGSRDVHSIHSDGAKGIFYPLDSFGYAWDEEMFETPILIDSDNEELLGYLSDLASEISDQVHHMSFKDRQHIHLAAVWVNNFTNACISNGLSFLNKEDIDPGVLQKLISTTFLKISEKGAESSQTGPAIRGDQKTMDNHIALMDNEIDKETYRSLSQMIINNTKK